MELFGDSWIVVDEGRGRSMPMAAVAAAALAADVVLDVIVAVGEEEGGVFLRWQRMPCLRMFRCRNLLQSRINPTN